VAKAVQGTVLKHIFVSFGLAFGGPALVDAPLFDELVVWALALLAVGCLGYTIRVLRPSQ
jgi:hypothetical protein